MSFTAPDTALPYLLQTQKSTPPPLGFEANQEPVTKPAPVKEEKEEKEEAPPAPAAKKTETPPAPKVVEEFPMVKASRGRVRVRVIVA